MAMMPHADGHVMVAHDGHDMNCIVKRQDIFTVVVGAASDGGGHRLGLSPCTVPVSSLPGWGGWLTAEEFLHLNWLLPLLHVFFFWVDIHDPNLTDLQ